MAKEIQKEWKPESGDYIAWISHPLVRLLGGKAYDAWRLLYPNQETMQYSLVHQNSLRQHPWLPRQDQLQEMVKEKSDVYPWTLNRRFWKWSHGFYEHEIAGYYNSFEKLWLAFVMSQRYGKVWDGEKWEKSTSSD